jgi:DNA-binding ferritin-like protein
MSRRRTRRNPRFSAFAVIEPPPREVRYKQTLWSKVKGGPAGHYYEARLKPEAAEKTGISAVQTRKAVAIDETPTYTPRAGKDWLVFIDGRRYVHLGGHETLGDAMDSLLQHLARSIAAADQSGWSGTRRNPRQSDVNLFQAILAHLRALQWIAWTSHWTASGPSYYGDHLLLQRLYAGEEGGPDINEQIDQLGERMVSYFGPGSVDPAPISSMTHRILKYTSDFASPYARLLAIEKVTQTTIREAWKANQDSGNEMSLGIDDYLMSLANERDTVRYLLQRRVADPGIYDEGSY